MIETRKQERTRMRGQGEELELEKTARLNWMGQIKHRAKSLPVLLPVLFDTRGGAKPITEAKSEYIREPHERGERWGDEASSDRGEMTSTSPQMRQETAPKFSSSRPHTKTI